jgi:hypothetical protein
MANHGYVTTRRILTPEEVDKDIREIVERRFKGHIDVEFKKLLKDPKKSSFRGYESWDIWALWVFSPKDKKFKKESRHCFEAWIMSQRKLEFRHPHGEWAWWGQMIVQEELAYKYGGTVSDEGVEERWKVTPEKLAKYRHYKDWITHRWTWNPKQPKLVAKAMIKLELLQIPEPLRSL